MTTKKLEEIRRRNAAGENDQVIAEALNIPVHTVHYWRRKLGLPIRRAKRPKRNKQITYTVWSTKTDEVLVCGTAKECAAMLGYRSADTFRQMVCRTVKKYYIERSVEDRWQ